MDSARSRALGTTQCLLMLCLVLISGESRAGLWDRDTVASISAGLPSEFDLIAGRFPRSPQAYYRVRLEGLAGEVAADPYEPTLYDDAAVASYHLGDLNAAAAWMGKKLAVLNELEEEVSPEDLKIHWYRYHANLGTILRRRWVDGGLQRSDLADLKGAHKALTTALEIDPDANLGCEAWELKFTDWLLHPPPAPLCEADPLTFSAAKTPSECDAAIQGIAAMIVYADMWESLDAFNAYTRALMDRGDSTELSANAAQRGVELVRLGKLSLDPLVGESPNLLLRQLAQPGRTIKETNTDTLRYALQRECADKWQTARSKFIMRGIHEGKHPDRDTSFWADYRDLPRTDIFIEENHALRSGPQSMTTVSKWRQKSALFGAWAGGTLLAVGLWRSRESERNQAENEESMMDQS